jgi:hypothetical protein
VLGVVREYNAIIASVAGERRLFTDRLRHLDRRVNSGVNKLSWNMDRSALEFYQKEARKFCREGTASVGRFKAGVEAVRAACARIADLSLVDLERKGVVQFAEFADAQRRRAEAAEATLRGIVADIAAVKGSLYEIFAGDGAEVQQQWLLFTERLDCEVLAALGLSVKRSLAELSRAINGDAKTEVLPLFYVSLELERALSTSETVELRPTLQDLANMIRSVSRELLQVRMPAVAKPTAQCCKAAAAVWVGRCRCGHPDVVWCRAASGLLHKVNCPCTGDQSNAAGGGERTRPAAAGQRASNWARSPVEQGRQAILPADHREQGHAQAGD